MCVQYLNHDVLAKTQSNFALEIIGILLWKKILKTVTSKIEMHKLGKYFNYIILIWITINEQYIDKNEN